MVNMSLREVLVLCIGEREDASDGPMLTAK